jgi:hypothetical protein
VREYDAAVLQMIKEIPPTLDQRNAAEVAAAKAGRAASNGTESGEFFGAR